MHTKSQKEHEEIKAKFLQSNFEFLFLDSRAFKDIQVLKLRTLDGCSFIRIRSQTNIFVSAQQIYCHDLRRTKKMTADTGVIFEVTY